MTLHKAQKLAQLVQQDTVGSNSMHTVTRVAL